MQTIVEQRFFLIKIVKKIVKGQQRATEEMVECLGFAIKRTVLKS